MSTLTHPLQPVLHCPCLWDSDFDTFVKLHVICVSNYRSGYTRVFHIPLAINDMLVSLHICVSTQIRIHSRFRPPPPPPGL